MRTHYNFICLVLFTFCPLARNEFSQGRIKCCFTFSNVRIPVKQVESYHITDSTCHRSAIIFITKDQRKICVNPKERWVQRLKKNVRPTEIWAIPETSVASSKVDREAKKVESIRTSETSPLQQPEETTLVHLKQSNDWLDFDTTQANPKNTGMAPGTRERKRLQRADESAVVVHLKESASACSQKENNL